jgi:uncharacterized transporter YbjL
MVGLKAGPLFLPAVREHGISLLLGGVFVTLVPLVLGLFFGRHALKLSPILLLSGLAGGANVHRRGGRAAGEVGQQRTYVGILVYGCVRAHSAHDVVYCDRSPADLDSP